MVLWRQRRTSRGQSKQASRKTSKGRGKRGVVCRRRRTSSRKGTLALRGASNEQNKQAVMRKSNGRGKLDLSVAL